MSVCQCEYLCLTLRSVTGSSGQSGCEARRPDLTYVRPPSQRCARLAEDRGSSANMTSGPDDQFESCLHDVTTFNIASGKIPTWRWGAALPGLCKGGCAGCGLELLPTDEVENVGRGIVEHVEEGPRPNLGVFILLMMKIYHWTNLILISNSSEKVSMSRGSSANQDVTTLHSIRQRSSASFSSSHTLQLSWQLLCQNFLLPSIGEKGRISK